MSDSRRDFDLNTADAPLINGALLGAPWQVDDVADLDEQWEDEQAYDSEPTPRAFCDVYEVHEPHWYRALNHADYSCPGITEAELADVVALTEPRCEHGLSAYLCGGPMHWYDPS